MNCQIRFYYESMIYLQRKRTTNIYFGLNVDRARTSQRRLKLPSSSSSSQEEQELYGCVIIQNTRQERVALQVQKFDYYILTCYLLVEN